VTAVVAGLNMLIYGVCVLATIQGSNGHMNLMGSVDGQVLFRLGARETYAIFHGEWWRLVVAVFLHANLLHIGMNTMVMVDLLPQIEAVYGSARALFLYVATGVFSFMWSTGWDVLTAGGMGPMSVGASGALMGLVGLMLAIASNRGGAYMREIRVGLIRWVVMIFAFGFLVGGIDNAAHFGGLAAGYGLGRIFYDREPQTGGERKNAYLLATVALLVVVGSFAAMITHYLRNSS
jgi:rhomboid protease GluP